MDKDYCWMGPLPAPDFTMVPDIAFDEIMRHCTGAEWKVLSWLMRETYGWGRPSVQITVAAICEATGITKRTAVDALRALEEYGMVRVERTVTSEYGQVANTYHLLVVSDPRYTNRTPPRKNGTGAGGQKSHRSSSSNTNKRTEEHIHPGDKYSTPEYRSGEAYRQGKYGSSVE